MGFMQGATKLLANDGNSKLRMVDPDICVIHTMAGYYPANAAHWSVRWDGHLGQHRDDDFQSAACYHGNPRCWAIEFEDTGPKFIWKDGRVPAMTDAQIDTGANVLVHLHKNKGLQLIQCPNSLVGARGVGPHRLGIDGNFDKPTFIYPGRVAGGERWSTSFGKICPDDIRITQIYKEMLPEARIRAGLDRGFMAGLTDAQQTEMYNAIIALRQGIFYGITRYGTNYPSILDQLLEADRDDDTAIALLTDLKQALPATEARLHDAINGVEVKLTAQDIDTLAERLSAVLPTEMVEVFDQKLRDAHRRAAGD